MHHGAAPYQTREIHYLNPQENGQVEATNRALEKILTKVVSNIKKYWET